MKVECIVDWRKMTLTNSDNYARLKRSGIGLLGGFCTPQDPLIEVAPDMHNKFSEIHRARHSIKLVLFLICELKGEHQDSVIDALVHAHRRGVDVNIILNGHLARQGDPGKEHPMAEELKRPLLPSVTRLKEAGIPVALAYRTHDVAVSYSPIHSNCDIDDRLVLEGSFNWYNASVFSHDIVILAANKKVAEP